MTMETLLEGNAVGDSRIARVVSFSPPENEDNLLARAQSVPQLRVVPGPGRPRF